MAYNRRDEDLAYGDYQGRPAQSSGEAEGERGLLGDMGKRFFGGSKSSGQSQQASNDGGSFSFGKLHDIVHDLGSDLYDKFSGKEDRPQGQGGQGGQGSQSQDPTSGQNPVQEFQSSHRYQSFAPQRQGNDIKWYVDGCSYMWAVSVALEQARESIYILDWWLSPELFLRRPPMKYPQYRLDRMLHAAAERGVKIHIIVYKEVTQALTLSSAHTKHHLEGLHDNIAIYRHPDHLPDRAVLGSQFLKQLQAMKFTPMNLAQMPIDSLKTLYGSQEGNVLYWAHHEKLCLIDGEIAFMGGLDLCYGRWDTHNHPIADVHPGNLDRIVFPGQDYNNARIMDFHNVDRWEDNKLERTISSRMGWSDVSLCLRGPAVQDLRNHFVERWNFIFDEKYSHKNHKARYDRLPATHSGAQEAPRGRRDEEEERGYEGSGFRERLASGVREKYHRFEQDYGHHGEYQRPSHAEHSSQAGNAECQITRSSAKWSHNIKLEHSIQNAYCEIIKESKHFVYIENQFFITSTGEKQAPVKNKVGAAIVERIVRAARNGEKYKMFVMMPSVPAFAGDLKADDALGTRAIMEFQYNSINRGHGESIYEKIAKEGVNPMDYIRFYSLRNYDRINASGPMRYAEKKSGVSYEQASAEREAQYEGREGDYQAYRPSPSSQPGMYEMDAGYNAGAYGGQGGAQAQYQQYAMQVGGRQGLGDGRWDSVSECYMLGGEDIRNVPWEGGAMDEMDAFVSEQLYIHSKLLIADDEVVICGSANLNDRSQCGDHDSEIAIIVRDNQTVDSYMDGRPHRASVFAASLRREIFRKHLGLLKPQIMDQPDQNFLPIGTPNTYDWGSPEDAAVADPLSDQFLDLWNWRAHTNTQAFGKVFHPVPVDEVRTWADYDSYYSRFFGQTEKDKDGKLKPSQYKWGHVVAENFSPGEQGVREVKEVLSQIKGTLVEMPLLFLKEEDMAQEGVGLNAFTETIYT